MVMDRNRLAHKHVGEGRKWNVERVIKYKKKT